MIVGIGLSGRFVAAGLGVMSVEQPNPRGIVCICVVIFSLAIQFDVWPFGWYNRRMEFLGRTGGHWEVGASSSRGTHLKSTQCLQSL